MGEGAREVSAEALTDAAASMRKSWNERAKDAEAWIAIGFKAGTTAQTMLALADWLQQEYDAAQGIEDYVVPQALAVARAYLGESA